MGQNNQTVIAVLLAIVLLLVFYYACACNSKNGNASEGFNNLKMMLCNQKGSSLSRDYNTRGGAVSANSQARSVLTGVVGQNGSESLLRAEVTPVDLSYEMYGIPSGVTRSGCDIDIYNLNEVKWEQAMRNEHRAAKDAEYGFGSSEDPTRWNERKEVTTRGARLTPELLDSTRAKIDPKLQDAFIPIR